MAERGPPFRGRELPRDVDTYELRNTFQNRVRSEIAGRSPP